MVNIYVEKLFFLLFVRVYAGIYKDYEIDKMFKINVAWAHALWILVLTTYSNDIFLPPIFNASTMLKPQYGL